MRQWVSRTLALLILVPGLGMLAPVDSSAAECHSKGSWVRNPQNQAYEYKMVETCTEAGPPGVTPSDPPGGGPVSPGCDLVSPATFCLGPYPCYYEKGVVPWQPPSTPPPTPRAEFRVRLCLGPRLLVTPEWVGQAPAPPTMVERSQAAFGQLGVPPARLAFNPTRRTLVNLDTWFWAQNLTGQPVRGTSARGLVAVATPGARDRVGRRHTPARGAFSRR